MKCVCFRNPKPKATMEKTKKILTANDNIVCFIREEKRRVFGIGAMVKDEKWYC